MKRRRDKGEERGESDLRWDLGLCFRHRPVISNQLWLTDSGGKFLPVNAACHSEGAGGSSWESGDEGRINWHSGGERWTESDGGPADGHALSFSFHPSFFLYCSLCSHCHRFRVGCFFLDDFSNFTVYDVAWAAFDSSLTKCPLIIATQFITVI